MPLKAFIRLTRIEHSVFLALAVVIGEVVITKDLPVLPTLLGIISVFFIGMGSFALNDFLDYRTDKKNKRKDRPLVTGKISLWAAIATAKVCFPLGVLFSLFINLSCFAIALVFSALAIFYSYSLKKVMVLGNAFIAFSMAIPFVFGSYIVSTQIDPAVQMLASMAFLTGFGREIIKSIQDMAGDRKYGRRTVPMFLGKRVSSIFAAIFILEAVIISPLPFLMLPKFFNNWLYLGPIIITDLLLLASVAYSLKLRKLEKVRKMTLVALGLGLLGFLLGAL